MIKLKNSNLIWINVTLLVTSIIALVKVFTQVKNLIIGREFYFGYEITTGWDILILTFWFFWLIGSTALIFSNKWSFTFLFPVSVLSILAVAFSFHRVVYKSMEVQIFNYTGLLISIGILLYITKATIRRKIGFLKYQYMIGIFFLITFSILFFVVDER